MNSPARSTNIQSPPEIRSERHAVCFFPHAMNSRSHCRRILIFRGWQRLLDHGWSSESRCFCYFFYRQAVVYFRWFIFWQGYIYNSAILLSVWMMMQPLGWLSHRCHQGTEVLITDTQNALLITVVCFFFSVCLVLNQLVKIASYQSSDIEWYPLTMNNGIRLQGVVCLKWNYFRCDKRD